MTTRTNHTNVRMLGLALLALSAVGCGADAGQSGEGEPGAPANGESGESGDLVTKNTAGFLMRTAQSQAEIFRVIADPGSGGELFRLPTNNKICYLTRVSGNMGNGAAIVVEPLFSAGVFAGWQLDVWRATLNSLGAEMTCIPAALFSGNPGFIVVFSPQFHATAENLCFSTSSEINMWDGTAVSAISGVYGNFEGGGEYAQIIPPSTPAGATKLKAKSEQCGGAIAYGHSIFAGVLGQPMTRSVMFSASSKGTRRVRMTPTSTTFCYLTKVSGNLDGGEERIRIFPEIDATSGIEFWVLETVAGGGSAYASAQCAGYDQRH
jgi:hypothetical protein